MKIVHYKNLKHKREYISAMKKRFQRDRVTEFLFRWKIRNMRLNLEIFTDVIGFVNKNDNCVIFISVDNHQYKPFIKLIQLVSHKKDLVVMKESELKRDSIEYKLSLIIDTMLNMERRK